MTERSLFNVACKITGVWVLIQGISLFVWALIAISTKHQLYVDPNAGGNLITGGVFSVLGIALGLRSSSLTRLVFRLDRPLDEHDRPDGNDISMPETP